MEGRKGSMSDGHKLFLRLNPGARSILGYVERIFGDKSSAEQVVIAGKAVAMAGELALTEAEIQEQKRDLLDDMEENTGHHTFQPIGVSKEEIESLSQRKAEKLGLIKAELLKLGPKDQSGIDALVAEIERFPVNQTRIR